MGSRMLQKITVFSWVCQRISKRHPLRRCLAPVCRLLLALALWKHFLRKDFSTSKWQGVRKKCFPDFSARTNRADLSGARRAEKSGKQIPFLRTNLKKAFFKFEPIWKRLFSNWFVGDLQICCHFQHKTAKPTSKQMVKTNTFPICFPKMFPQLNRSLKTRVEGIWGSFRNFGNFWNLWISVDWKPWNFVQKPWSFGQTSRILEHFWNIFGNLGISVHSVFLVQVNNGYGTNSNHIRMKKPPLTRGTAGPEFPYSNSKQYS